MHGNRVVFEIALNYFSYMLATQDLNTSSPIFIKFYRLYHKELASLVNRMDQIISCSQSVNHIGSPIHFGPRTTNIISIYASIHMLWKTPKINTYLLFLAFIILPFKTLYKKDVYLFKSARMKLNE